MKSAKQEFIELIERFPDETRAEIILAELHVKTRIMRGVEQLERGETVSHAEVMEDLAQWLKSIGP